MNHRAIREAILESVYRYQEDHPNEAGMNKDTLERLMAGNNIDFDLRYLVEKGWIRMKDGFVRLTVEGIDYVELQEVV